MSMAVAADEAVWRQGERDCIELYEMCRRFGWIDEAQEKRLIQLLTSETNQDFDLDEEAGEIFGELAMVESDLRGMWQYVIERTRYVRALRRYLNSWSDADAAELARIAGTLQRYADLIVQYLG